MTLKYIIRTELRALRGLPTRDVRIRLFYFGSVFEKTVSVWMSLVRLKKLQLGSDIIVLFTTHVIAE